MLIIGCDFHTRYQQIVMAEDSTDQLLVERRLDHESGEAEAFYRSLQKRVRVVSCPNSLRMESSKLKADSSSPRSSE